MALYEPGGKLIYASVMGDSFELMVTGTTIFNNENDRLDVSAWEFDNAIQRTIIESSSDSKFKFEALKEVDKSTIDLIRNGDAEPDIFISSAREQGGHILIVFAPVYQAYTHPGDLFNHPMTQHFTGYGLTKLSKFGNERNTSIYSSAGTFIFDLKTGEQIGSVENVGVQLALPLEVIKYDKIKREDLSKVKDQMIDMVTRQAKNHLRDLWICNCW